MVKNPYRPLKAKPVDHWENLDVSGKLVLRWVLEKYQGVIHNNLSGSR
jgi:hypothetical protein